MDLMDRDELPPTTTSVRHSGAAFERGDVHRVQQEAAAPSRADSTPWSGGHKNYSEVDGRRRKLKATPHSKTLDGRHPGQGREKTIFKGATAVEDEARV